MKRKFMALFISLAMIFSSVISVPAKVFAEGVNIPSFTDFVLNDDSSVKATWDKAAQTLTVKGNGKSVFSCRATLNSLYALKRSRKFSGAKSPLNFERRLFFSA